MESLAESRRRYAAMTRDERYDRVFTEIELGIRKAQSFAVTNEEDSARLDALAESFAKVPEGTTIAYDVDDDF